MTRPLEFRQRAWSSLASALALAAVVSCGGGDGVVGSGGTGRAAGVTQGTVNGFGSVIVDGLVYDDRGAPVVAEIAPGVDAASEARLGHRVVVDFEAAGAAMAVRLDAALAGTVASIVSPTRFSMLGQTVTINTVGTTGPITQFGGGYGQASDLRAGDPIEVHGLLVRPAGGYLFQATRIDKLAAAPAYLRISGLASALSGGATTSFALGALGIDATGATVLPAGAPLANGQAVTVLALPGTLAPGGVGAWRAQAAQVRIRELRAAGLDDYVSGSVSRLDTQAKTFALGGLLVNYTAATLTPNTSTALANEQYVQARGMIAADGSLIASTLAIRDAGSDAEAELKGNISAWVAATKVFGVRGVTVDASRATVTACPASGLANGLFVQVEGAVASNGVVAKSVHCENEPAGGTVEREGTAGAVNTNARTFTLTQEGAASIGVQWADTTYFGGLTPPTLSGKRVQVEGALVGGVLIASKVKLND